MPLEELDNYVDLTIYLLDGQAWNEQEATTENVKREQVNQKTLRDRFAVIGKDERRFKYFRDGMVTEDWWFTVAFQFGMLKVGNHLSCR